MKKLSRRQISLNLRLNSRCRLKYEGETLLKAEIMNTDKSLLDAEGNGVLADVTCRNSVRWFATKMEAKLAKNDHKGGWGSCELQYLSMRLTQERKELTEAIKSKDKQRIIDECADIANFALMIADKFGENYGR